MSAPRIPHHLHLAGFRRARPRDLAVGDAVAIHSGKGPLCDVVAAIGVDGKIVGASDPSFVLDTADDESVVWSLPADRAALPAASRDLLIGGGMLRGAVLRTADGTGVRRVDRLFLRKGMGYTHQLDEDLVSYFPTLSRRLLRLRSRRGGPFRRYDLAALFGQA